jgi:hypothetical protein
MRYPYYLRCALRVYAPREYGAIVLLLGAMGIASNVWGAEALIPSALACPSGYQAYAERCVSGTMFGYLACIETQGGDKQRIEQKIKETFNQPGASIADFKLKDVLEHIVPSQALKICENRFTSKAFPSASLRYIASEKYFNAGGSMGLIGSASSTMAYRIKKKEPENKVESAEKKEQSQGIERSTSQRAAIDKQEEYEASIRESRPVVPVSPSTPESSRPSPVEAMPIVEPSSPHRSARVDVANEDASLHQAVSSKKSKKGHAKKKATKVEALTPVDSGEEEGGEAPTMHSEEETVSKKAKVLAGEHLAAAIPSVPEESHQTKQARPFDEYKVDLGADAQVKIPGTPGELRVWIGIPSNHSDFPSSMVTTSAKLPAVGETAKIEPFSLGFEFEPKDSICMKIDPSGSEVRFKFKAIKEGTFDVSADVHLFHSADCSGVPIPKATTSLKVQVVADPVVDFQEHLKQFKTVFWAKLLDFWGGVLAVVFAGLMLLIKGRLKRWFGGIRGSH